MWVACCKQVIIHALGHNYDGIFGSVVSDWAPDVFPEVVAQFVANAFNEKIALVCGADMLTWESPQLARGNVLVDGGTTKEMAMEIVLERVAIILHEIMPPVAVEEVEVEEEVEVMPIETGTVFPTGPASDPLVITADACDDRLWIKTAAHMKNIRKDECAKGETPAVLVLTSPPWGKLEGKCDVGGEDEALTSVLIKNWAVSMHTHLPSNTIVALNVHTMSIGFWEKKFQKAKWKVYTHPFVVCQSKCKNLDTRTKYQVANNAHFWVVFHKEGVHPEVPASVLSALKMYKDESLAGLWQMVNAIPSLKVPAMERVRVKVGGKGVQEYLRTQQLAGKAVAKVIHAFGRASTYQARAFIIDPFVGAGGTLVAAHLCGCWFVGSDRDAACAPLALEMFHKIKDEALYVVGSGLPNLGLLVSDEDADNKERAELMSGML